MMKKLATILSALILFTISAFGKMHTSNSLIKDAVVIEVNTKFTLKDDALIAAKNTLFTQKFIAVNDLQKSSFTATCTTGSKADYYLADVNNTLDNGKIKLTISFIKMGTGFSKLQNVADAVKAELEK